MAGKGSGSVVRTGEGKSKSFCCTLVVSGYLATMDWQQPVSLMIVGTAAVMLLGGIFRRRKFSFEKDTHCGCVSRQRVAPQHSIVFRARKGERPQVWIKMK